MRPIALALCAGLLAAPAVAQRETKSADAATVFQDAIVSICVPAVASRTGVSGLPAAVRAKLQASSDANTRQKAGAAADETVWDVAAAKGVVAIREKPGRCAVSVYGLPVVPTILNAAQALSGSAGFERLVQAPPPNGFGQSLTRKGMIVQLNGSEPGMSGHRAPSSVVTATMIAG